MKEHIIKILAKKWRKKEYFQTHFEATVTLIPKSKIIRKKYYIPISLMKIDTKILNKIFISWIQHFTQRIIFYDQLGFIQEYKVNLPFENHTIYYIIRLEEKNHMIVSTNQKIDIHSWFKKKKVLNTLIIEGNFLNLVRLIYKKPAVKIFCGKRLHCTLLRLETRQRCSLYWLLFSIALEGKARKRNRRLHYWKGSRTVFVHIWCYYLLWKF